MVKRLVDFALDQRLLAVVLAIVLIGYGAYAYRQVPAEQQLNGTPNLTSLSSISMLGLSVVTMTFEDGTDDNLARQQVLEKMQAVQSPLHEAVLEGSKVRLRPVLMTALMAAIGMYPAATSHGIGSEVQRPLALVILGGMLSAVLLTLIVLPVLYELLEHYFPAEVTVPEGLVD